MFILSSELYLAGFVKLPPLLSLLLSLSVTSIMYAMNSSHFVISRADQRARQRLDNDNYNQFLFPIST